MRKNQNKGKNPGQKIEGERNEKELNRKTPVDAVFRRRHRIYRLADFWPDDTIGIIKVSIGGTGIPTNYLVDENGVTVIVTHDITAEALR